MTTKQKNKIMAVEFVLWAAENYSLINSARLGRSSFVNHKEHQIFICGGDWHYAQLIQYHGLSANELYDTWLNLQEK